MNGRVIQHPRGKVLGGSSAINSHALLYPSRANLDAWADLGNPGWEWKNMEQYYNKAYTIFEPTKEVKDKLRVNYLSKGNLATKGYILHMLIIHPHSWPSSTSMDRDVAKP